jgi:hypothetical protein
MSKPRLDPISRFFSKVDKTSSCWLWTGGLDKDGYGLFQLNGKQWRAHRYSQFISNGLDASKPIVLHTCDNPSCVNPEHLLNGTVQENNLDKVSKRRHPHKFKDSEIATIRSSTKSNRDLANEYNVGSWVIWYIRSYNTYKHLP